MAAGPPLVRRARPQPEQRGGPSTSAPSSSTAGSTIDDIAAARSPSARVERAQGDVLDPPLLRAAVDLTRRNMIEFVGGAMDVVAKREELSHPETRHIAVRSGRQLLGFAAWRLTFEDGVRVGYVYELQLEESARGMRLGSELLREVEASARAAGALGLMLTVHTRNAAARRFYKDARIGFAVSPLSPAECAPPLVADACDYEILHKTWDDDARRLLVKKGAAARRANYVEAIEDGRFKVRLVQKGGRRTGKCDDERADPMTDPRS